MSNLAQFVGGYGPLSSIVNYFSSGGTSVSSLSPTGTNNAKAITTAAGSQPSGTLVTALSLSSRGRLNLLAAYALDATARNIRLQVIVDGVTVFDATSNSVSAANSGLVALGSWDGSSVSQVFQPVDFYQSVVVKYASSVTEADKIAIAANYELWT